MRPLSFDDRFETHRHNVKALRDGAGIEPPPLWLTLNDRLDSFLELQSPTLGQLCAAVSGGAKDNQVIELRAQALAEVGALPASVAQVNNTVAADIFGKMVACYAKHGQPNYQKISAMFDSAATDFTDCVSVVDPETPADQLVTADEPIRQAWSDAALHAARLDHLTEMLATAAELADVTVRLQPFDGGTLALTVDPATSTRAELFKAWQTRDTRGGRWTAIVKTHATIRAHSLDSFAPYHPDDDAKPEPPEFDPVIRRRSGRAVIA